MQVGRPFQIGEHTTPIRPRIFHRRLKTGIKAVKGKFNGFMYDRCPLTILHPNISNLSFNYNPRKFPSHNKPFLYTPIEVPSSCNLTKKAHTNQSSHHPSLPRTTTRFLPKFPPQTSSPNFLPKFSSHKFPRKLIDQRSQTVSVMKDHSYTRDGDGDGGVVHSIRAKKAIPEADLWMFKYRAVSADQNSANCVRPLPDDRLLGYVLVLVQCVEWIG